MSVRSSVGADGQRATSEWPQGELLETAARYVAAVRHAPGRPAQLRAVAEREGPAALGALLRSLPVVDAPFSDDPAGDEIRQWFGPARLLPLDRVPVALLRLPATGAEYLRGRSRQAMRTNITRATQAGLSCAVVTSDEELRRSVHHIATRRGQDPKDVVLRRPRRGLIRHFSLAYDAAGDPVALSEFVVDGDWAGLAALVSGHGHDDAQAARYLLHAHTMGRVLDEGASTVVVGGSMLLTSAGTRYFQRRTGFQPVWLRPSGRAAHVVRSLVHRPARGGATSSVMAD
jgi:hypothetical protein